MTGDSAGDKGVSRFMGTPLVTVGIPVRNGSRTIGQAIQSILNQTYPNVRVLISDNGSTDGTSEICRHIAEKNINVSFVQNSANVGATRNFNRVLEESVGEYFKWMGHDDVLHSTALEKAISILESDSSVSVAHWLERVTDSSGDLLREYGPVDGFQIEGRTPGERFRQMLQWRRSGYKGDPIYGVIRRSALMRTSGLSNKLNPNYLLLEELSITGGFVTIPEILATRVYNDKRTTAERLLAWLDSEAIHRFPHFARFREHVRIGMRASWSSPRQLALTAASLFAYALRPQELKGFGWDIYRYLTKSFGSGRQDHASEN